MASCPSDWSVAVFIRPRVGVSELRSGFGTIAEGVFTWCGGMWLWGSLTRIDK